MVWIGVGPAAEAECTRCPIGPPCPQCRSRNTEPFRDTGFFYAVPPNTLHCWPCGHVWIHVP